MLVLIGIVCVVVFMIIGILTTWAAWMRGQRAAMMPKVAAAAGLNFSEFDLFNSAAVPFALFREGDGRRIQNVMWREATGHPRVFEYGYYTIYKDKNGNQHQSWQWFVCALVQHNGKWPDVRLTKENLIDRAIQTLGLPDIELESEEFNQTYVVQCRSPKFATDLLDPQMMEYILGTEGKVDVQTKGRFLLMTTDQLEASAMVGLLGFAEGVLERVPPMVWDLYGRFPEGMGTEEMPPPPSQLRTEDGGLFGMTGHDAASSFTYAPAPRLGSMGGDAWDPTPDVDYDLDGNPVARPAEDPWGEGRS